MFILVTVIGVAIIGFCLWGAISSLRSDPNRRRLRRIAQAELETADLAARCVGARVRSRAIFAQAERSARDAVADIKDERPCD